MRDRLTTDKTKIFARENPTLMSVTKTELRELYNEIFDRLQEYEVAEETGKIIVPPCKVGDIVKCDAIYYRIYRTQSYSDFETPIHHRYWAEPINDEGEDDFWFWSDRVEEGTVVICSKEEAEQALKGSVQE